MEQWKYIESYGYKYMVSTQGNIKSFLRCKKGRLLKLKTEATGYKTCILSFNKTKTMHLVHRLVADAFIVNTENKPIVNHIDEDKTNNRVTNLNWMTAKENINYGTSLQKRAKSKQIKVAQYTLDGTYIKTFESLKAAKDAVGMGPGGQLAAVCKGRTNSAYGFRWRYAK